MQDNSIRPDQITQVRGFADQRLRKSDAPLDPSSRRISLIVQYLEKKPDKGLSSPETSDAPAAPAKNPPPGAIPVSTPKAKK